MNAMPNNTMACNIDNHTEMSDTISTDSTNAVAHLDHFPTISGNVTNARNDGIGILGRIDKMMRIGMYRINSNINCMARNLD